MVGRRRFAAASLGLLVLGPAQADAVSLARDVQPIFDRQCVTCHLHESPQGGLILEAGDAHAQTVGVPSTDSKLPRVSPGDPERSYLMYKLRGTHLAVGGKGAQMPFNADTGSSGLPKDELDLVEAWIRTGAPDN